MAVNNVVEEDAIGLRRASEARLAELEAVIDKGLKTFIEVGRALQEIAEFKLYLVAGYKTFADYTFERVGLTRNGAYNKINAAQVVDVLAKGSLPAPQSESQARALAPLLGNPEVLVRVYRSAGAEKAQTRHIQRSVQAHLGKVDGRDAMRGRERILRCPHCGQDFPARGNAAPRSRDIVVTKDA